MPSSTVSAYLHATIMLLDLMDDTGKVRVSTRAQYNEFIGTNLSTAV